MAGSRRIDLTGQQFGRLTVMRADGQTTKGEIRWACRCACGGTKTVRAGHLKRGIVASCGCYRKEWATARMSTHRRSQTQVHRTWRNMRERCQNPRSKNYPSYGGRGITVCERWQAFENFYADMGDPPSPQHSIDRIDNDRGYEPGNCRWTTMDVQGKNRRRVIRIDFDGRCLTLKEWGVELGLSWVAIRERHRNGEVPPALFRPVDQAKVHR